jgi:rhodanese-related sulfurtransferase
MQNDQYQKENENLKILAIGFALIIFVAVITIFKFYAGRNSTQAKIVVNQTTKTETVDTSKISKITPQDLMKKIQARETISLIDLRNGTDYATEHIADSQNIPLSEIPTSLAILDKNKTLIFFDYTADVSTINSVANFLSPNGYKNIYYLEGGFSEWKNGFNPTVNAGNSASFSDQAKVNYITPEDLKKIIDQKNILIIDVRVNQDFNLEHLNNAINIPLSELEKRRSEINSNGRVILYDKTGNDSFKGAVRLFDLGFFNVFSLSNGIDAWKQKGFETVR